jgi:uncharacterized protein YjbJ (UPF0337 family)
MSDEEAEGKGKQVKGKLREAAGALTGDEKAKAKGRMEQTEGKAKEKIGEIKRKVTHDEDL